MKYEVIKNRLTNGVPFDTQTAADRITALADAFEITQAEAEELAELAKANGGAPTLEERVTALEMMELERMEVCGNV